MRETGPVRKDLTGDEAAPYVGPARTLLGKLKNDMEFNKLLQGQRTQDLPDGTRIIVTSMFGRDKVTVVTAGGESKPIDIQAEETKSLPVVHEDDAELEGYDLKNTVICGNSADQLDPNGGGIATITAWVYQPGKNLYTTLQNLGEGTICTAISDDGMTVVGATFKSVVGVGFVPIPTVWKNGAATLLTTGLDPTRPDSYGMASDVSADGKVVVAGLWDYSILPRPLYYNAVWVNKSLAAIFPVLAGFFGGGGFIEAYRRPGMGCPRTPCVSADGKTLGLYGREAISFTSPTGVPPSWIPINSINATWALGHQDAGSVSIGGGIATGTTYEASIWATFTSDEIGTYTMPRPAAPVCVENNGTMMGLGDYLFRYDGAVSQVMTPSFYLPPVIPEIGVGATTTLASRSAMNAAGSAAKGRSLFVTILTAPNDNTSAECVVYEDGTPSATLAGKFVNATTRDGSLVGGHSSEAGDVGVIAGGWYGKPRIIKPVKAVWGGKNGGMTKELTPPGGPYSWVAGIGSNSLTTDPPPKRLDRG